MSKRSPERLRVTNPASLAVASIVMLGYQPYSSVVIVPVGVEGPVARMPLPENPERDTDVAAVLARAMTLDMPREIALCVFDDSASAPGQPPRGALIDAFQSGCAADGIHIVMAVHVGRDSWCEYPLRPSIRGEQGSRHDIEREVQETLKRLGRPPLAPGPNDHAGIPRTDRDLVHRVAAIQVSPLVFENPAEVWERMLTRRLAPSDREIASILAMIGSGRCRDLMLVQAVRDLRAGRVADRVGRALERGSLSQRDEAELDDMCSVIVGLTEDRPHLARMERFIALLRRTAEACGGPARARALGMIAWAHWVLSAPNIASLFADEARVVDSSLTLAGSIDDLIEVGHLPRWYGRTPRGVDR